VPGEDGLKADRVEHSGLQEFEEAGFVLRTSGLERVAILTQLQNISRINVLVPTI
jgi:hypothetical protein